MQRKAKMVKEIVRANNLRTGGKILVDQLINHGIERIFCVPGESYLEILDALYDVKHKITVFNARHEAAAANMAEAAGKLGDKPGVAMVTRGPGACHASIGVHIARQDSTPMILIVGQVSQATKDREAFQEIDYESMFGKIAKWCAQIEQVDRIPEYLARAINVAMSGRPGPVVLSIPENVLRQSTDKSDMPTAKIQKPAPTISSIAKMANFLNMSKKPMFILGGSDWTSVSGNKISKFAEKLSIPVVTSFRRQDVIDNSFKTFAGSLGTSVSPCLEKRIKEADLIFVLGARLGEMTTSGYSVINPEVFTHKIVHVHLDPSELGSVYPIKLGIVSSMANLCDALLNIEIEKKAAWTDWSNALNRSYKSDAEPPKYAGPLDLGKIFKDLDNELPKGTIITLDAGNHTGWPQRFLKYSFDRRQIGSTCGSMGYAIPAAVAASLMYPEKFVLGLVGDGGFMMTGMELMTAVQYKLSPMFIVFNNSSYGTIRMHQERDHPGRVIATDLVNPSFTEVGKAMGIYSEVIRKTEDFLPAFSRCRRRTDITLLELITDKDQLSSRYSISDFVGKT